MRNKIGLCLMFFLLSLLVLSCTSYNNDFTEGKGTIDNPYIMKTYEDLFKTRLHEDFTYYELANDIYNSTNVTIYDAIGPLNGVINGNGYSIHKLILTHFPSDKINNNGFGLYSELKENSKIMNLSLVRAQIDIVYKEGPVSIGSIIGSMDPSSSLENVSVKGYMNVSVVEGSIGGIAGLGSNIKNAYSDMDITVTSLDEGINVGGIVGELQGDLHTVMAQGDITICNENTNYVLYKTHNIGGIIGYGSGDIEEAVNDTEITFNEDDSDITDIFNNMGGISGSQCGSIRDSISVGVIESPVAYSTTIGGITGIMSCQSQIEYSFALTKFIPVGDVLYDNTLGSIVGTTDSIYAYQMIYYHSMLGFDEVFGEFESNPYMQFDQPISFFKTGDIIKFFDSVFVFEIGKLPRNSQFAYEYRHQLME